MLCVELKTQDEVHKVWSWGLRINPFLTSILGDSKVSLENLINWCLWVVWSLSLFISTSFFPSSVKENILARYRTFSLHWTNGESSEGPVQGGYSEYINPLYSCAYMLVGEKTK